LITVFQSDGKKIRSFGEVFQHRVRSAQHLWNTVALDVDDDDNLWVAFMTKPLLRKYRNDGVLLFEKEPDGTDIREGRKQDRPDPEMKTYVYYFTDIHCLPGNAVIVMGHNWGYEFDRNGTQVSNYEVDFPKSRDQQRYFFIYRIAYNKNEKDFLGISKYDGLVYSF
jgi:hypothetical protein